MSSKSEARAIAAQHQHLIGKPISKSSSTEITHLAVYPVTGNTGLIEAFQNDLYKNGNTDTALAASEENDYQVFVIHYSGNPKKAVSRTLSDYLTEDRSNNNS
jgi:hypothetical protein